MISKIWAFLPRLAWQKRFKARDHHIGCYCVHATFGDNDIRETFCGFHELDKTRADSIHILVDHGFDRATAFGNVPLQTTNEADILICVHKELHRAKVAQLRFDKYQDPFHQDNWLWQNMNSGCRTGMLLEVINW